MNMQKLIVATAGAALLVASVAAACASTIPGAEISLDYSVTASATYGTAPGVTDILPTSISGSLALGSFGPYAFVTLSPNPSSGACGTTCENWNGDPNSVAVSRITATFSNIFIDGVAATPETSDSVTGRFYADYDSLHNGGLGAVCSTPNSPGAERDCVVWGSGADSDATLNFDATARGVDYTLTLNLHHAEDWNITPTIGGSLQGTPVPPTVPEPASLALFASALLGLPVLRRRRARKTAA